MRDQACQHGHHHCRVCDEEASQPRLIIGFPPPDPDPVTKSYVDAQDALRTQLEVASLRLIACGAAARGWFRGCAEEYRSSSLQDVLQLRAEVECLRREKAKVVADLLKISKIVAVDGCHCGGCVACRISEVIEPGSSVDSAMMPEPVEFYVAKSRSAARVMPELPTSATDIAKRLEPAGIRFLLQSLCRRQKAEAVTPYIAKLFEFDPELRDVYRFITSNEDDPDEPIKLLQVTSDTPATGSVDAFSFLPTEGFPYRTAFAQITPEEFQLLGKGIPLPDGWRLETAVKYSFRRSWR